MLIILSIFYRIFGTKCLLILIFTLTNYRQKDFSVESKYKLCCILISGNKSLYAKCKYDNVENVDIILFEYLEYLH